MTGLLIRRTPSAPITGHSFIEEVHDYLRRNGRSDRPRLDPAGEVEILLDIMTQAQQRIHPQTQWIVNESRSNLEIIMRWDNPNPNNRLELRADVSTYGGVWAHLSTAFTPSGRELDDLGYTWEQQREISRGLQDNHDLCHWHMGRIRADDFASRWDKNDVVGHLDIYRHDGLNKNAHTVHLDHSHPCLDGIPRYLPGYLSWWQRDRLRNRPNLVENIVTTTQGYLLAAAIG
jgi:hypothetical protein